MNVLDLIEAIIGRRMMWKIGRRLYLHARREGSLEFDANGEATLQSALARRSAETGRGLRVIDVGANYGQWSRSLLERLVTENAPAATMTLFEPVPPIREKLAGIVGEFPGHSIDIVASALSDAPGVARMVVTSIEAGNHHLDAPDHAFDGSMIEVPVSTLDLVLADANTPIDIVKIDAEGFDPKVILGMEGLLSRQLIDVVQFEYSTLFIRSRAYLYDIFEIASRNGYRVALLTRRGFEIHSEWHPDLERFYASAVLILHERAENLLPSKLVAYGPDNTHG